MSDRLHSPTFQGRIYAPSGQDNRRESLIRTQKSSQLENTDSFHSSKLMDKELKTMKKEEHERYQQQIAFFEKYIQSLEGKVQDAEKSYKNAKSLYRYQSF